MNLFTYSVVREVQEDLIKEVETCLNSRKNLIVHAPTGLGKTVATLAPALKYALDNKKTIFFLTSRHTQHNIAIETLKLIKEQHSIGFCSTSIIGKKWMCLQPGVETLYNSDFVDYCKRLKEDGKCNFYKNTRQTQAKFTIRAASLLNTIEKASPLSTEEVIRYSDNEEMCPYEISIGVAKKAKVIITDYYYLFHPDIGDNFLTKINKELENLISSSMRRITFHTGLKTLLQNT